MEYQMFKIMIEMSDHGAKNLEHLLRVVFAQINEQRRQKPPEYSFHEIQKIGNIKFHTIDVSDASIKA